jgi:hypothetical protein
MTADHIKFSANDRLHELSFNAYKNGPKIESVKDCLITRGKMSLARVT